MGLLNLWNSAIDGNELHISLKVRAQGHVGVMYRAGLGVAQDYVQAYAWNHVAGASGDEKSLEEERILLLEKLTPEQIAEAEKLSTELYEKIQLTVARSK